MGYIDLNIKFKLGPLISVQLTAEIVQNVEGGMTWVLNSHKANGVIDLLITLRVCVVGFCVTKIWTMRISPP